MTKKIKNKKGKKWKIEKAWKKEERGQEEGSEKGHT